VSARELTIELERLAIAFPRTDMDSKKWMILFQTFYEDLKHKTLGQIQDGCRRYRQNADNRFFPTPGQLLEACKNPFDMGPERTYHHPDPLPPIAAEVAAKRAADCRWLADELQRKSEGRLIDVEDRKPIEMTPELQQRERDLREERAAALQRALDWRDAKMTGDYLK